MFQTLILAFPQIDPVAAHLGPLAVRWYALAYMVGILGGWWLLKSLNARKTARWQAPLLSKEAMEDIVVWATVGIVLGGRVGYVLFYNLPFYLDNPGAALKVWQGGMSFHGGLSGMLIAMAIFARKHRISWVALMDLLAICAPIGICLGRLANFVNGELYGRLCDPDLPWGMVFPHGGDLPRHPSQLYEAGLEGVALFLLLLALGFRTRIRDWIGALSGWFLIGYSLARIVSEHFREPDLQIGYLAAGITMGQVLSLPMLAFGLYYLWRSRQAPQRAPEGETITEAA